MSIDDRLEKLAERHEALAQTVELMAAENQQRLRELAARDKQIDKRFTEVIDGIARLLHVAEIHEHRSTDLQ
jgi:hypothetical protein